MTKNYYNTLKIHSINGPLWIMLMDRAHIEMIGGGFGAGVGGGVHLVSAVVERPVSILQYPLFELATGWFLFPADIIALTGISIGLYGLYRALRNKNK